MVVFSVCHICCFFFATRAQTTSSLETRNLKLVVTQIGHIACQSQSPHSFAETDLQCLFSLSRFQQTSASKSCIDTSGTPYTSVSICTQLCVPARLELGLVCVPAVAACGQAGSS